MKAHVANSSLLTKYTQMYKSKPHSRVFAPLAETYRKLGMLDEALKILDKGIRRHPSYILGHIVLAHCYFDKEFFGQAYRTLLPFVGNHPENIRLQKLFAQICFKLAYLEEAMQAYKIVLLVNPRDEEAKDKLKQLEDDLIPEQKDIVPTYTPVFDTSEDDWVQVSFDDQIKKAEEESIEEQWQMGQGLPANREMEAEELQANTSTEFQKAAPQAEFQKEDTITERELDDEYYYEEYDNAEANIDDLETDLVDHPSEDDGPAIVTHTLVDLYCNQGHFDKAKEVLESILKIHPNDQATQDKLIQVQNLVSGKDKEEEDQEHLLDLVDRARKGEHKNLQKLENLYYKFLDAIRQEAKQKLI